MSSVWHQKAQTGGENETLPAGNHGAVLVALVDLGTRTEIFKDKKTNEEKAKKVHKIAIVWELTSLKKAGMAGQNFCVVKDYFLSFYQQSALRKMLEAWRGKAFAEEEDIYLDKTLGKPCMVNLVHKTSANGNTFAKVEGVSKPPAGLTIAPPTHTPFMWEITSTEPAPDLSWLPYLYGRPLKDHIAEADEVTGNTEPIPANTNGQPHGDAWEGEPADSVAGAPNGEIPF